MAILKQASELPGERRIFSQPIFYPASCMRCFGYGESDLPQPGKFCICLPQCQRG